MNRHDNDFTQEQGSACRAFEPFVSVADAATVARISKWTVWRKIRKGEIPAFGFPGALRVRLSEVMQRHAPARHSSTGEAAPGSQHVSAEPTAPHPA